MKHAINWFEIPVSDINRSKLFYSTVFKCGFQDMEINGNPMAMFDAEGVSGSLWQESNFKAPMHGTRIYLTMPDSIDATLSRVSGAGGEVIQKKAAISAEIGWTAVIADPDGNRIGLYEDANP